MARTLIHVPAAPRRGVPFEVRVTIAHPMETGYRTDDSGRAVPRDILTHFECRLDGRRVFAAELHPAVAAHPMVAFFLRAEVGGTLSFTWEGDHGFRQTETVPLTLSP